MVFFQEKMNDDILCMQSPIFFQLHRNKILSVNTDATHRLVVAPVSAYCIHTAIRIAYQRRNNNYYPQSLMKFQVSRHHSTDLLPLSTLHQTNDDRAPSRILPILSGREQLDVPSEPIKRFLHQ